ncbi:MAG: alpha-N-arabinofuranosidase [Vallitaleaceae bacterium]|jgi:alpha-N-arabinofuranosidase|nr:alpha-N-arabinofuranosidase [Vallitaleaceae bacterium]
MKKATCYINRHQKIADIDDRLYGSFIEHMGRAVYTGIYEPDHASADDHGFRTDVIDTVKELKVPLVRDPGGNFLSGYNWKDGIGPQSERPTRLDLAWQSLEDNSFGIDEFYDWTKAVETTGMIAVNLGTGTPAEAGQLIEYCNIKKGTYWSDLRVKNGHEEPHDFKVWCLGNEMDGPWQIGQLSAEDYGKKARETGKILKWVDPDVELVLCGSSGKEMSTFPEWDMTVLDHCYNEVDYISLHRYYEYNDSLKDFLASYYDLDEFIQIIKSTADYVKAKHRSDKVMMLSLDEWNVWYMKDMNLKRWQQAPAIAEDVYNLMDALVVGGLLCTIINNADRVKIACLAQLVNALSPIHTEPNGGVLRHSTFYPFKQVSTYGRGEVYRSIMDCDAIVTEKFGSVPSLQSLTTYDSNEGSLSYFVLNTEESDDTVLTLDFQEFGNMKMIDHQVIMGDDLYAFNSFETPLKVVPVTGHIEDGVKSSFEVMLPKLSWHIFRFQK